MPVFAVRAGSVNKNRQRRTRSRALIDFEHFVHSLAEVDYNGPRHARSRATIAQLIVFKSEMSAAASYDTHVASDRNCENRQRASGQEATFETDQAKWDTATDLPTEPVTGLAQYEANTRGRASRWPGPRQCCLGRRLRRGRSLVMI